MEENKRCQYLLQQKPACYGWLRRKHYLQHIGERVFEKLNRRATLTSITSKLPWERQFVVLKDNLLYIFSDEAASKPNKEIEVNQFNRVEAAMELVTNDVPWPFKLIKEAPSGGKQEVEYFCSPTDEEQNKWIGAIAERLSPVCPENTADSAGAAELNPNIRRPLPPAPGSFSSLSSGDSSNPPTPRSSASTHCPWPQRKVPVPPQSQDDDDDSSTPIAPSRPRKHGPSTTVGTRPTTLPKPPAKPNLKLPQPDVVPQPPVSNDSEGSCCEGDDDDDDEQPLYEVVENATFEDKAFWDGSAEDAQKLIKKCTKGVYLLRDSSEGASLTLLVNNVNNILKYSITKSQGDKRVINGTTYNNINELLYYYHSNFFPKRTLKLTMPYKEYLKKN